MDIGCWWTGIIIFDLNFVRPLSSLLDSWHSQLSAWFTHYYLFALGNKKRTRTCHAATVVMALKTK
jgi:hypothetical protein